LRLTEEGAALHEQTRFLLDRIDDVAEGLKLESGLLRGRLRVSAPVLFAHRGLGHIAARYVAAYPDVQLEITADDRFVDPLSEGYELVIRANPLPATDLAGRCFLRDEMIVAAHPALSRPVSGHEEPIPAVLLSGMPDTAAWQLAPHTHGQDAAGAHAIVSLRYRPVLRLSSMVMVHDAVLAGAGAAMLPRSLVQADVAAGRLIDWGSAAGRSIEVWALYPPHRHVSRKVSAFVRMLVEQFADASPSAFLTLANPTN
jgi:DNA-binding transcriptional LysR family regulator